DESKYVIAPEVKALSFRYFDGSTMQWADGDTWDGTQQPTNAQSTGQQSGTVMMGPPSAIEITIRLGTDPSDPNNQDKRKTCKHVVTILTANGQAQQAQQNQQGQDPAAQQGQQSQGGSGQ